MDTGSLTALFELLKINPITTLGLISTVLVLLEWVKSEWPTIQGNIAKIVAGVLSILLSLGAYWGINGIDVKSVIFSSIAVYIGSRGGYKLFTKKNQPTPPAQ
jgi:hypothetical protein